MLTCIRQYYQIYSSFCFHRVLASYSVLKLVCLQLLLYVLLNFPRFLLLPLKAIVDLVISISLRLFLLSIVFQINNLWDIVPAEVGDRFLSMLPPWHAYERASEYFIFTFGSEQVYTTVKNLKVFFFR